MLNNNLPFCNNILDVVHYYSIKVYDDKRNLIEFFLWSGMKWNIRIKYDWYFNYRAALLQVKYPKYKILTSMGNEPASFKTLLEIKNSKIIRKKAKITELKNKLKKAIDKWDCLFPIEEDIFYQQAVKKIAKLEFELTSI